METPLACSLLPTFSALLSSSRATVNRFHCKKHLKNDTFPSAGLDSLGEAEGYYFQYYIIVCSLKTTSKNTTKKKKKFVSAGIAWHL